MAQAHCLKLTFSARSRDPCLELIDWKRLSLVEKGFWSPYLIQRTSLSRLKLISVTSPGKEQLISPVDPFSKMYWVFWARVLQTKRKNCKETNSDCFWNKLISIFDNTILHFLILYFFYFPDAPAARGKYISGAPCVTLSFMHVFLKISSFFITPLVEAEKKGVDN